MKGDSNSKRKERMNEKKKKIVDRDG